MKADRILGLSVAFVLTSASYWTLSPSGDMPFSNWLLGAMALHAAGALIWAKS